MKINKTILELVCRWYVFIFLNTYGLGKIAGGQFYKRGHLPEDVANLTLGKADAFNLAWTFMGFSYAYILFVGILQVIGACLLLWNKTKIIGVGILLPIMANIIVFDIVFLIGEREVLVNAFIYFIFLLAILYFNKAHLLKGITAFLNSIKTKKEIKTQRWKQFITVIILMGIVFTIDQLLVNFFRT